MACIEVKVSCDTSGLSGADVAVIGGGLSANVRQIGDSLLAKVFDLSERLSASVSCRMDALMPKIAKVSEDVKARCSIICSFEKVAAFIDVRPEDIQWITDDKGVYFDVESNVEWVIVVS